MVHRVSRRASTSLVFALLAGSAFAQDFSNDDIRRCQPPAVQTVSGLPDDCEAHLVIFGLNGPSLVTHDGIVDVEATGSLPAGEGDDPVRSEPDR